MAIYKTPTASVGTDGKPIYDVFEDGRKLELPEFQSRQLNIDQIGEGTAPTGFKTGFTPVSITPKDEVPNTALEASITRGDIERMMKENQTLFQSQLDAQNKSQNDIFNQTLQKMQLTPEEKASQDRLLGLRQMQQNSIESAQERPLDGTILKGGLQAELQNITSGNTRESLVNLRQQAFETQKLQLATDRRNQELETLKMQLEQGNVNTQNLFKTQELLQQNQNEYFDKVMKLEDNARTSLATILDKFKGLTLDNLSPENIAQISALAAQSGIPIDILREGMKTVADQIEFDKKQTEYENQTARINATKKEGTAPGEISEFRLETAKRILDSVGDLYGRVDQQTAGLGFFARKIPTAAARDFAADLTVLKSNIAQTTLQQMRDASKTGGALGQVSEKELVLLENSLGALDQSQSPENLRKNLKNIEESVRNWDIALATYGGGTGTEFKSSSGKSYTLPNVE